MCGIAGIVTGENPSIRLNQVHRMLYAIRHRGPDEVAYYSDTRLSMAINRLSIVGLTNGQQPYYGCKSSVVATFNGEIYNYKTLRDDLIKKGHEITNQSDGAILPHLYEEYGIQFVSRLNGMFSLVLLDKEEGKLFIARDRAGMKPLFFHKGHDRFLYSSEVKGILASGLVDLSYSPNAVADVMTRSFLTGPASLFKGIEELPPGHVLELDLMNLKMLIKSYWSYPEIHRQEPNFTKAAEKLRDLLDTSVQNHMSPETGTCAFLSGGLDSSIISAMAKKHSPEKLSTFSLGFKDRKYDESSYAKEVARHLGTSHRELIVGPELVSNYPETLWNMEFPLIYPQALAMRELSKLIRAEGYKVVLSGEGADELFYGYDFFKQLKINSALSKIGFKPAHVGLLKTLYKFKKLPADAAEFLYEGAKLSKKTVQMHDGFFPGWIDQWRLLAKNLDLLKSDLNIEKTTKNPFHPLPLIRGFEATPRSVLHGASMFEFRSRLPQWILAIADRASMAEGVEARLPFLSNEVIDFSARLPDHFKLRMLTEKAILRRAFQDYLPPGIVKRPKQSFLVPVKEWFFTGANSNKLSYFLSHESIDRFGMFDSNKVMNLKTDYLRKASQDDKSIYDLQQEWGLFLVLGFQMLFEVFEQKLSQIRALSDHDIRPSMSAVSAKKAA